MKSVGFFVALALAACGPEPENTDPLGVAVLEVSPAAPQAGASLTLTLRNEGAEPIGYNLCTSQLQRRAGDDWIEVPEDRVCTMELRMLPPGGSDSFAMDLPADLAPDEHRYAASVHLMDSDRMEVVWSPAFRAER